MPVAKELAEMRACDGDVSVPGTTVPGIIVPRNMAGSKPLTAVAVGNRPVERTAPVLKLGTRKNVKQYSGEHLG